MDIGFKHHQFCITRLSDDALYVIFKKLDTKLNRESFSLTCHHFLDIQDLNLKCLEIDSLRRPPTNQRISSCMLEKLLNRFRQLESLSVNLCIDVTDSGLRQLQNYGSKLHSLYLHDLFKVTNKGISYIASGCPLLSVISLSFCKITNRGLKNLSKSCKYLEEVNLFCCANITDNGIRSLNQNCRQLRTLNIGMCQKISGVGFQGCLPTLACLKAHSCVLSSTGITEMLSGGGLEYLNFANIICIGDNGLAAIGLGFAANLKILDFNKCRFVTDDVVLSIAKGCPLLQEWNLSHCNRIGTSGWYSIGLYCKNLERLHVSGCYDFHNDALLALGNGCERLLVVSMKSCFQVFSSVKNSFRTQREGREIIEKEVSTVFPCLAFTRQS
ncbi:RNI-like superfamily protein [Tanacetum coccineum]